MKTIFPRRLPSATYGVPGAWGNLSLSPNIAANVATATDATAAFPNWYQYRVRAVDGDTSLPSAWALYPPGLAYVRPLEPPGLDDEFPIPGYDDYDSDGLSNQEELDYATDPTDPDSDNDGFQDGADAFATQREFKLPPATDAALCRARPRRRRGASSW